MSNFDLRHKGRASAMKKIKKMKMREDEEDYNKIKFRV